MPSGRLATHDPQKHALGTLATAGEDEDDGTISPTFAQFAYMDGAVRKTRNRAYQKQAEPECSHDSEPLASVTATSSTITTNGTRISEGSSAGHGSSRRGSHATSLNLSVPAVLSTSKRASNRRSESISQGTPTPCKAAPAGSGGSRKTKDEYYSPTQPSSALNMPFLKTQLKRTVNSRSSRTPELKLEPRISTRQTPLTFVMRTEDILDSVAVKNSRVPTKGAIETRYVATSGHSHRRNPRKKEEQNESSSSEEEEDEEARLCELDNKVIYGFPITLLTSPTRNWMPVVDKHGLVFQSIREIMLDVGLNGIPMLIRRFSWRGRGGNQKYAKRGGRSTRSVVKKGGNAKDDTSEIEDERRRLVGGVIDLRAVLDGVEAENDGKTAAEVVLTSTTEFVDVDVDISELLAGTECIAFTNLAFYRIIVPSTDHPIPPESKQGSKLDWDSGVSKPNLSNGSSFRPPWIIRFMGYEWETVRTELLDEADDIDAEDCENTTWVTTQSGHRIIQTQGDLGACIAHAASTNAAKGGWGSGVLGAPTSTPHRVGKEPGDTTGMPPLVMHPWGRDRIEPPPVGIYAERGTFEEKVQNWFPWATGMAGSEIPGSGSKDTGRKRSAAVVCAGGMVPGGSSTAVATVPQRTKKTRVEKVRVEEEDEDDGNVAWVNTGSAPRRIGNKSGKVRKGKR